MKISELARAADTSKDTVRHYVELGLLQASRNPDNGYQIFNDATLKRLNFIKGTSINWERPLAFRRGCNQGATLKACWWPVEKL